MRSKYRVFLPLALVAAYAAVSSVLPAFGQQAADAPAGGAIGSSTQWATHAPWNDPKFFPIAVWLQSTANAARYRAAGINTYVALWKGPTATQLDALQAEGLKVICSQNPVGLEPKYKSTVIGWMHGDEPDNAQEKAGGGWGPPILPERIVENYKKLRERDPQRPVLLNLGQGVAWDNWHGRGVRSRHPEDYPLYIEGCDIASFDIYPAVHDSLEVAGKLWYVAQGVERLKKWSGGRKGVWNCLECTRISTPDRKPTPDEVRAEAWMSLIHGSQGLIYFVHQFKPNFREAGLFDDEPMLKAVTALNAQITKLAPVINSAPLSPGELQVTSSNAEVPIAATARRYENATYVFAVCMRDGKANGIFKVRGLGAAAEVQDIETGRTLSLKDGAFQDEFGPWQVRLYRIK